MTFVFLWTDLLLWLIACLFAASAVYIYRQPLLKAKWSLVFHSNVSLIALIIFLFYFAIGLLDSVHFQTATQQNYSLLDKLIEPARLNEEKTYSAPFAYRLYTKSYGANKVFDYQALIYGGVGIDSDNTHLLSLVKLFAQVLLYSMVFFLLLWWCARAFFNSAVSKRRRVVWGTVFVLIFLLVMVWLITPHYHLFGTDKTGIDVFYQAIKGVRTALIIGLVTTLMMLPFAVVLGLLAGYLKGFADDIIQYIYTTLNAIPGILLIAALVLTLQVYMDEQGQNIASQLERSELRLLLLCMILGLTSWTGLCRLIRAEALKLSQLEFVKAAQVFGVGRFKIMMRHLLPNVMHLILISVVLDFTGLVLAEVILSYVGVGVDAHTMSWGNMINVAKLELVREPVVWWPLLAAFIFMTTLVLVVNILADHVRRVFDVKAQV